MKIDGLDEALDGVVEENEQQEIPAQEPEAEYDVEELPEPEVEAQDPEGDLKTAYSELRQQRVEEQQEYMAHRAEAERLIRGLRDRLENQTQRPTSDDEEPWAEHPEPRQQAGDPAMRQEVNAMKQELAALRSERQQDGLRTSIADAAATVNTKYGLPVTDFPNIVYEMQQNRGMTADQAARRVGERKIREWKRENIVKRTKRERAPDMPGGLRSNRQYTMPEKAPTNRDEMDTAIDAFLDGLGDENIL